MNKAANNYEFYTTFYGNKISEYGRANGRVDYKTLSQAFDGVCNDNIVNATGWENWTEENGSYEYYKDNNGNYYTYEEAENRKEELQTELDELGNYFDGEDERAMKIQDDLASLEEPYYKDIFQYIIISELGAEILGRHTNELVLYNSDLDMYVWCIDHYGTKWDHVLTDIPCEKEAD